MYGDTAFGFGDSAHDCGDAAPFVTLLMMMVKVVILLASMTMSPLMAGADSKTQVITFSINGLVNTFTSLVKTHIHAVPAGYDCAYGAQSSSLCWVRRL